MDNQPQGDVRAGERRLEPPHRETVRGDEQLNVYAVELADGRYRYLAQCRYVACDGSVRDDYLSQETYDQADRAIADGIVKARQLAGIDVPEA